MDDISRRAAPPSEGFRIRIVVYCLLALRPVTHISNANNDTYTVNSKKRAKMMWANVDITIVPRFIVISNKLVVPDSK